MSIGGEGARGTMPSLVAVSTATRLCYRKSRPGHLDWCCCWCSNRLSHQWFDHNVLERNPCFGSEMLKSNNPRCVLIVLVTTIHNLLSIYPYCDTIVQGNHMEIEPLVIPNQAL